MTRIVIVVDGGLVQSVYCSEPAAIVEVIDKDVEGYDLEDEQEVKAMLMKLDMDIQAGTLVEV